MVYEPVGGAAHEAVPRVGVAAVSDDDQVEGVGPRELHDALGRAPGGGAAVQGNAMLLGKRARLRLDQDEVGVLCLLFFSSFR